MGTKGFRFIDDLIINQPSNMIVQGRKILSFNYLNGDNKSTFTFEDAIALVESNEAQPVRVAA